MHYFPVGQVRAAGTIDTPKITQRIYYRLQLELLHFICFTISRVVTVNIPGHSYRLEMPIMRSTQKRKGHAFSKRYFQRPFR